MSPLSKAVTVGLVTGILGLILVFLVVDLEEDLGLRILFKLRGVMEAPADVVVVSMDRESAKKLNLEPKPDKWPRSKHAILVENLKKAGAAVIAFDIFFGEGRSPKDEKLFAAAIRNAGNVVLIEQLIPVPPDKDSIIDYYKEELVPPLPILRQSALALAPFPLPQEPLKINQFWMFKTSAGDKPTLPVVVFQIFALETYDEFIRLFKEMGPSEADSLPNGKDLVLKTKGIEKLIRSLRDIFLNKPFVAEKMLEELQNSKTPFLEKNQILKSFIKMYQGDDSRYLNFYGPPGTITTIPYCQLIQPGEKSSGDKKDVDLKGKVVFIGCCAQLRLEKKYGFPTVFSRSGGKDLSGVEIAATAFANLLEDKPIRQSSIPVIAAFIFLWGLGLGVVCRIVPTGITVPSVIGLGLLYLCVAQYKFNHSGNWYPMVVPLFFQAPFAFFAAVLWKYRETHKERQQIKGVFRKYIPEELVEKLAKEKADIRVDSETVQGTCLHTDAGQYTALSENLDPNELSKFMNKYYEAVFKPVTQHGGYISDILGDAIMAIWATAYPDVSLSKQACLAALSINRAVDRFNQTSDTTTLPTRIGLHSGEMVLGNIGAIDHYEYRAVGDIVVTTTRIEGLNKYLGTRMLVSEEVKSQLDDFLTRDLGEFILYGKSTPIRIYELICLQEDSDEQQQNLCDIFSEALRAFRKQSWRETIKILNEIMKTYGGDGPSRFFFNECEKYMENPPGERWAGAIRMDRK
jgi:adenylate cyclase